MAEEKVLLSKSKENGNGKLRKRVFLPRNSLLTDLFENGHFQSIRHIFMAIFMCLFLGNILQDYYGLGGFEIAFGVIRTGFGEFDRVILIWLLMFASTLTVHPLFTLWAKFRPPKSEANKFWDQICLFGLIIYYILFLAIPPYLKGMQMPFASSGVVICEQIRFFMKTHAFIRSNAPNILISSSAKPVPSFAKYLYFLFAPTLLYRDTYPRTKNIRWTFAISHLFEFISTVIFLGVITSQAILPKFRAYPGELTSWRAIVLSIFNLAPVAVLVLLTVFYFLFHCWMNFWAELTRFGDRQFYEDWWTVSSFSTYFRRWSGLVHDYLHEYIYRDFYETIVPGDKTLSALAVFLISAIFHEHLAFFMIGYFYPVLMVQFLTFGVAFTFAKIGENQLYGNIFLWTTLIFGVSMQITLLSMEYYARISCPRSDTTFRDYFIPRSWSC